MSGVESTTERKQQYFTKLIQLLDEYPKIFVVGSDNVGSNHMQQIRRALRGKAVLLMGKNTLMRKAIKGHIQNNPDLEDLLPYVRGNIGFVFTKEDLSDIKKVLTDMKVAAPAKVGAISPCDVIIPSGNTGLEPTQTSFLQALNIQSKISRGQIEIIQDVHLLSEGQRVGSSEATLLAKLDIKPFRYGLSIISVYDNGNIYEPYVLDLTDEDIVAKFKAGVRNVSCIALKTRYPTMVSVPHLIARGYKNVLSVSMATSYSFPKAQKIKDYLENPEAFAVGTTAPTSQKAEEKPEEETKEESEEEGGMGGLFGEDEY